VPPRINTQATFISHNITKINQYKTWMVNQQSGLSASFPAATLPTVSSADLAAVTQGERVSKERADCVVC
jgi:hypothetical protein